MMLMNTELRDAFSKVIAKLTANNAVSPLSGGVDRMTISDDSEQVSMIFALFSSFNTPIDSWANSSALANFRHFWGISFILLFTIFCRFGSFTSIFCDFLMIYDVCYRY